jgi:hypothetical protein
MPNDETQPCPHCNGTGEVRCEAPAAPGTKWRLHPAQRTVAEVLAGRNGFSGCCESNVNRSGCDCFEVAEQYERALELAAGRPPPRRCPTCKIGSRPTGKVFDVALNHWVQCKTCNGKGLLYGLRPEHELAEADQRVEG